MARRNDQPQIRQDCFTVKQQRFGPRERQQNADCCLTETKSVTEDFERSASKLQRTSRFESTC